MSEVLLDTIIDTLKLIPFLFLTYLLMELIEHKTSDKTEETIKKAGRFGPVIGGLLGVVPQCGFSASAASLYSGKLISLGTLAAVFLSTSDEMLPVLLSEKAEVSFILRIIGIKVAVAVLAGIIIDLILKLAKKDRNHVSIHSICEHDHCNCEEEGIFKSALHHSFQITIFIFIISLVLNFVIYFIGEDKLGNLFVGTPVIGCLISSLVGLIPNCAASVVITELYLNGVITGPAMLSGLLTGCGIGILVLFRTNKNFKENLSITLLMYLIGVAAGTVFGFFSLF